MAGNLVKKVMLKIVSDDGDTESKLDRIGAKADELGRKHPDIKVKVDSAAASAKLAVLRRELKDTGNEADKQHHFSLSGLMPAIGEMSMFQKVMLATNVATTFAEPLMAGLVVSTMGVASGLTAAGMGLGVFGMVAKSVYSQVSTAVSSFNTAQSTTGKAAATATKQYRAELAALPPAQRAVARSIISTDSAWQTFVQHNTAGVATVMSQGMGLLPRVFALMQPFLRPTETALSSIIAKVKTRIGSSSFIHEIGDFAKASGPDLEKVAAATGHVAMGILGILHAFLPTSGAVLGGLDKWTSKFEHWGQTLSGHSGFQSMMQMFHTETPIAVHDLGQLAGIVKTVVADMTGLSGVGNSKTLLELANPVLTLANALLKANPALVRLTLYLLAGASGAKKLGSAFGGITSGIGAIKSGVSAVSNLSKGVRSAEQAASTATGAWGTFGGTLSRLKISNLTAGFRDADAAASDTTGVLGTLGGKASTVWSGISAGASAFAGMITGIPGKIGDVVEAIKGWSIWSAIASGATKVWTGVQAAFDAVMDANPIAIIVLAVVALIAVIVLMVTHLHETAHIFDMVRHAGAEAFDAVRHAVATAFDWIKGHWPLLLGILAGPFGLAAGLIIQHFAEIRHWVASTFDDIRHDVASAFDWIVHEIESEFDQARHTIASWGDDVLSFFRRLPGMIISALGSLGSLLVNAGESIMGGLLHGIESGFDRVRSFVSGIGSWIASHKGPITVDRVLLRPHGQAIMDGLVDGMQSRMPQLAAQVARATAAITGGIHGAPAGGYGTTGGGTGGTGGWVEARLVASGGEAALLNFFMEQIKLYIRNHGGGGTGSVQRALGQNA